MSINVRRVTIAACKIQRKRENDGGKKKKRELVIQGMKKSSHNISTTVLFN